MAPHIRCEDGDFVAAAGKGFGNCLKMYFGAPYGRKIRGAYVENLHAVLMQESR
jgi:hypothetical protein